MNSINNFSKNYANSAFSTIKRFSDSSTDAKIRTAVDFLLQVWPKGWGLYLTYTAIRCTGIVYKLNATSDAAEKRKSWEEAQVYVNTKVVGIVASTFALAALGLTTPSSAAIVLSWGIFLSTTSTYAYMQTKPQPNQSFFSRFS